MANKQKPIRLWRHKNGTYYIRLPGTRTISTRTKCHRTAQEKLESYIRENDRDEFAKCPPYKETVVSDILIPYMMNRVPELVGQASVLSVISTLNANIGSVPIAKLNGALYRQYARDRCREPGTIRKELKRLSAVTQLGVQRRTYRSASSACHTTESTRP